MDLFEIIGGYKRKCGMDPDRILTLISRLPDTSMLYAVILGKEEWQQYLGWGQERQIAAGVYDLITILVRGSINWEKGKEPKLKPWERPNQNTKKEDPAPDDEDAQLKKLMAVARAFGAGPGIASI